MGRHGFRDDYAVSGGVKRVDEAARRGTEAFLALDADEKREALSELVDILSDDEKFKEFYEQTLEDLDVTEEDIKEHGFMRMHPELF